PIGGYDYAYRIEAYQTDTATLTLGKNEVRISLERDSSLAVTVEMENDTTIRFDLVPLVDEIYLANKAGTLMLPSNEGGSLLYPAEKMEIQRENTHFVINLLLDQVNGDFRAPHEESSRGIYIV